MEKDGGKVVAFSCVGVGINSKVGIDDGLSVGEAVDMLITGLILGDIVGFDFGATEGKDVCSKDGLIDGLAEGDVVVG